MRGKRPLVIFRRYPFYKMIEKNNVLIINRFFVHTLDAN